MPVAHFEILKQVSYEDGRPFGDVGSYERIDAIAHYIIDPENLANSSIIDLSHSKRNSDCQVEFTGDVTIIKPVDLANGNGALLVQVPNRGNRSVARLNLTPVAPATSSAVEPGDGFLFRNGWSIAWVGWQWDVPRTAEQTRIGLTPPMVPLAARTPKTQMQLRIQPNKLEQCFALTDHHVGNLGHHTPICPLDPDDDGAQLLVRRNKYESPEKIERGKWKFVRAVGDHPISEHSHIWLKGGFKPGLIYDILFTPKDCPVVGAGMLATRDCTSFLRYEVASPFNGRVDHVIGEGQSQCGRFLRTFLHLGLNSDQKGRPAFDGVLAHIAGGRRGEFNHRYGQPSVQPTPSFGHLFPFGDLPQFDPLTGRTAGLLDRHRKSRNLPKIFYTDTSTEYWRGDAGLCHTELASGDDANLPKNVRRYLFASTQHGPGIPELNDATQFGSRGCNPLNIVDYRPLYRAALQNLLDWVKEEKVPPDSVYPSVIAGTRRTRREVMGDLTSIDKLVCPNESVMTTMHPLDLGPYSERGVGEMPPHIHANVSYPDFVSAVNDDGNETGGIRMPDVEVPVATHAGFNPRHPSTGGEGQLLEYVGSTLPFARDRAEREATGDPRRSIAERYENRDEYLAKVREAAEILVKDDYLLLEDIGLCIEIAALRYDLIANKSS